MGDVNSLFVIQSDIKQMLMSTVKDKTGDKSDSSKKLEEILAMTNQLKKHSEAIQKQVIEQRQAREATKPEKKPDCPTINCIGNMSFVFFICSQVALLGIYMYMQAAKNSASKKFY